MMMNNIYIMQQGHDYLLVTPQGIKIAYICCPPDGQMMGDAMVMKIVTRVLAKRWGVPDQRG